MFKNADGFFPGGGNKMIVANCKLENGRAPQCPQSARRQCYGRNNDGFVSTLDFFSTLHSAFFRFPKQNMSHSKSAAATKRIVGDTRINEDASEGHGAKYKVGKAVWAIDVGDVVYTCTVVHFTVACQLT